MLTRRRFSDGGSNWNEDVEMEEVVNMRDVEIEKVWCS